MSSLALKIAAAIKRSDPEGTHPIEILIYSLTILLNTLFIFLVSLSIGWVTGKLQDTFIVLIGIALLRLFSGGKHLQSEWGCNIFSVLACTIIPHIASLTFINPYWFWYTMFSLVTMIVFSPQPDNNTNIPLKYYPILKVLSITLVGSNFLIGSSVIGIAFLLQSLTVISIRRED